MGNLATLLETSTEKYADRTAIVFGDTRLTYAQVNGAANQVANLLVARGIKPGDKVALSCPNLPYFTVIYYGILKAGATVVPLNVLLKAREVAYHLADSDAKAYFAFEGTPDLPIGEAAWDGFQATETCTEFFLIKLDSQQPEPLSPPEFYGPLVAQQPPTFDTVETDDDDTAVILYTSGTTGQPKGAELRHRNMRDNALAGADLFGADATNPDTYLCVLPLFHSFGQTVIQNGAFAFGGTVVMLPRFEATAALGLMLKEKVTFFAGVPTMYWGLLGALDETMDVAELAKNLRVAAAGGSALPVDIHRQFKERFGVTILEGYGLSETSPVASFSRFGEEPRVGSIGIPIPGVEMKLINDDWSDVPDGPDAVGEIAIKGHNIMKGYYDRPEATAEAIHDDWFRSGDLAKKDADGFYYIVDRSKDMIIRGGFNVYPRELEEILMEHPAVSLVAVIGVPHESHGEEIKAFIVKNKDHDDVTEEDLVAWGKEQFAAYKYPRTVEFIDELPMTSTGKILKRELSWTQQCRRPTTGTMSAMVTDVAPPGVFHINPETGRPNRCPDTLNCKFGGDDFHYASQHDAEVAWKARRLERGIIAYRSVMQAREKQEEKRTLEALTHKAQGGAKKVSWGVVRSLAVKNLSKYLVNFTGLFFSYLVVSGRWLGEDWARRFLPVIASVTLVGFSIWFGIRIFRGSRHTVHVVKRRRRARKATRTTAR